MKFTKQDAYTFLIGLAVSVVLVIAQALTLEQSILENPSRWALGVLTGVLTATGRYILTYLTQKGFTPPSDQH